MRSSSIPRPWTAQAILAELKPLGRASYKKVLFNHGITEPSFGVKISELQKIRKRIGKDHQLALDLYDSGNYDAMYLAGLIADEARMTKRDLQRWVTPAHGGVLASYTVAGVAAESSHGWDLALKWIESKKECEAAAGWATLSNLVSIKPDADLDIPTLERLLRRVAKTIHHQPDRTRYQMNGFVIAAGCFVPTLTASAIAAAERMGRVTADLGNNACRVPDARDYIHKVQQRGRIGKKRQRARC
jgi:3-methyladenine DNA glycosylase AlkD